MSEIRTIRDICRDELLAIKVDVPIAVLAKKGDNLVMSAFDWVQSVDRRCWEKKPVPTPLPWLSEFLTAEQRTLDWKYFCDVPPVRKQQRAMFG